MARQPINDPARSPYAIAFIDLALLACTGQAGFGGGGAQLPKSEVEPRAALFPAAALAFLVPGSYNFQHPLVVMRMSIFAIRLGFALVVAALCLGGRPAHTQSAPVRYWTPGWLGFGGNLNAGQGANADGDLAGFGGSDAGGFSPTRTNFPNGWFVGNQRGGIGLTGINHAGAFGSLYTEGVQFGYNLKNAPVTVFAGFDTLKYNSGIGGISSPFDSTSGTVPGFRAHAGVEIRPTSNLSLSLGLGYVEQSGRIDSDTKVPSLSNASQFDLVGGRR